ncbi:hypothetical protein [Armatimonas sp.]|uniref:hypothetical protein n=1 Tax=Armatimonas sp. TaxID=1872638 RepID=UPI00286A1DEE|nr:hypothetical protein [Armatimonas sp.]
MDDYLASREPGRVATLARAWDAWAERCHVVEKKQATETAPSTPQIANRALLIQCDVLAEGRTGVILAQGGQQNGYALHLNDGKLIFSVRIAQKLTAITASEPLPPSRCRLEAQLARDGAMTLLVNDKLVATGKASGLIPTQPQDGLSIGRDEKTAVGEYAAPNPLAGSVLNVKVSTR